LAHVGVTTARTSPRAADFIGVGRPKLISIHLAAGGAELLERLFVATPVVRRRNSQA
jgi:hypothetical protein